MIAALLGLRLRTIGIRRVLGDRDVEIERLGLDRKLESWWQHADDRVLSPIELDRSSEDVLVAAEPLLPEVMAQDHFKTAGPAACLLIGSREITSDHRL